MNRRPDLAGGTFKKCYDGHHQDPSWWTGRTRVGFDDRETGFGRCGQLVPMTKINHKNRQGSESSPKVFPPEATLVGGRPDRLSFEPRLQTTREETCESYRNPSSVWPRL